MSYASVRQCFGLFGSAASQRAILSAAVIGVAGLSWAQAATTIVPAGQDAEMREQVPEFTRGATPVAPSTSTQEFELAVSSNPNSGGNRQANIMRFTVPANITSVAQLEGGFADLRLIWRLNQNQGGGSIRWYGLDPMHAENTTWDEQSIFYRDAGAHQNTSVPASGVSNGVNVLSTPSPIAQISPGANIAIAPVAPVAASAGYGANANAAGRAPGIKFENAPFSQQVATENAARYTYNQQLQATAANDAGDGNFDGYVGDPQAGGTQVVYIDPVNGPQYSYVPYVNQPAYTIGKQTAPNNATNNNPTGGGAILANVAWSGNDNDANLAAPSSRNQFAFSNSTGYSFGIYNDVSNANRPYWSGPNNDGLNSTNTSNDDLTSDWVLLGHTDIVGGFKSIGTQISFTSSLGGFTNTNHQQMEYNLAQLLAFLESGLSNGVHDFTFLITTGTGAAAGVNGPTAEWLNGTSPNSGNQQFASSEFTFTGPGGVLMSGAPQLVLSPEPATAISLFSLAGLAMIRARRRAS